MNVPVVIVLSVLAVVALAAVFACRIAGLNRWAVVCFVVMVVQVLLIFREVIGN